MTEHAVVVCANEENCYKVSCTYLLSTMNLGRLSGQSAQPGLSVKTLGKQEITIPQRDEQIKISELLGIIDEKIQQSERINDNLVEQIRTLCNAWLSDYEPFGGECPNDWELLHYHRLLNL